MSQVLGTACAYRYSLQPQAVYEMPEEGRLLGYGFPQGELNSGEEDLQRNPREAGARPYVNQATTGAEGLRER